MEDVRSPRPQDGGPRKAPTHYLRYGLNIGISVAILVFLLRGIPLEEVLGVVRRSRAELFCVSLAVGALSIVLNALRWQALLKHLDYGYDLRFLSRFVFIALFFNVYLPGGVAGDIVKVAILPKEGDAEEKKSHLARIAASAITDRLTGMVGLMFLAFAGFAFCCRMIYVSEIFAVFGLLAFAVAAVFVFLFSGKAQRFAGKALALHRLVQGLALPLKFFSSAKEALKAVAGEISVYGAARRLLAKTVFISVLAHLCVVVYFFLLAKSVGLDIGFLKLLAFVPVIEFISAIPVSFAGAGIREMATILLFSSQGVAAAEAMSVSLLSLAVVLVLGAIGGILFFYGRGLAGVAGLPAGRQAILKRL